jgi:DNA helicase HerA-like ATPase
VKKLSRSNNKILAGQHTFIAGKTGSGKTVLEKVYISGFDNAIILDTKGLFNWIDIIPDAPIFTHIEDLFSFKEGKAIYRPSIEELNNEFYDLFFKWIYYRRNTAVAIDEVMSLYESANSTLFWHKALMTRGRELNITVFNCTQRPKTIPLNLLSESTHFFIFDLNLEADRKRIMEIVPFEEINIKPSKIAGQHSFWYYNDKLDKPLIGKLKL